MGMVRVKAVKMIWTPGMVRLRKDRVFDVDEKLFNAKTMVKVSQEIPCDATWGAGQTVKQGIKPQSLNVL